MPNRIAPAGLLLYFGDEEGQVQLVKEGAGLLRFLYRLRCYAQPKISFSQETVRFRSPIPIGLRPGNQPFQIVDGCRKVA